MSISVLRLRADRRPLVAALACAFTSLGQAQSLPETVVTATRVATRADEVISDVRVIDRSAIEASGARSLAEVLARQAGVQMASNGGRGAISSVFMRGAENRHTVLLVDGVRIGSASAGTPTWEALPLDQIERIEVLKGPASALYGSDAAGGVIQVFTRRGREGFHPSASVSAGSRGYQSAGAGVSGGQGGLSYALGLQHEQEGGYNYTQPYVPFGNYNPDKDPFRQESATGSLGWQFTRDWSLSSGFLYSDGVRAYDDGLGRDARDAIRSVTLHTGIKGKVLPGWNTELRWADSTDTNNTIIGAFPGSFVTGQTQWTWQNDVATPIGVALAGLERREQRVTSTTAFTVGSRTIESAFAGLNGSAGAHSWQANVRQDRNSQFGNADTGFAGYGYKLNEAWRVTASHGTSFVAPSFNQLYFPTFGNPALQPEHGRNTDLGVRWSQAGHEVKLTRFDNRIRGFMTNTTLPVNIPRVRIQGWSLGYAGTLGKTALRADLELLDPRNDVNGLLLPRRAREQLSISADRRTGAWTYGASLLAVGKRFDDTANTRELPGYATADLHATWQFARDLSLQGRLLNASNRQYETAYGYNQPGRAAYLTLRWQPK